MRTNERNRYRQPGSPYDARGNGSVNPSGWMKEENFLKYAKHFAKHAKPSKDRPLLLLLDNHDSHLSIEVLDYFKDNGVTVLSFPSHCSHKLQPLDRSVYGPLKKYFNTSSDNWLASHPGKTLTIYDIPELVKIALPLAATLENIQAGFKVTGISPLNENIFPESEFMGAYVTDRPLPEHTENVFPSTSRLSEPVATVTVPDAITVPKLLLSDTVTEPDTETREILIDLTNLPSTSHVRPEDVRPFPKAGPRQKNKRNVRKRTSTIYTDTPEKQIILEQKQQRDHKQALKKMKLNKIMQLNNKIQKNKGKERLV
ncbi:hypothetical protein EVAR_99880_1 [Eumeta japonica]|uniref:DDE-1 domain-containing protein n=1 Tax=Eumeta variegata TaxID=151549 RepID=A0A4C1ZG67_EUMVA|nr:hypothetical protein EVAR_99880_1 [Eumeta japonica]